MQKNITNAFVKLLKYIYVTFDDSSKIDFKLFLFVLCYIIIKQVFKSIVISGFHMISSNNIFSLCTRTYISIPFDFIKLE